MELLLTVSASYKANLPRLKSESVLPHLEGETACLLVLAGSALVLTTG